jgi:hypothetical protein
MNTTLSILALAALAMLPLSAAAQTVSFSDTPLGTLPAVFQSSLTGEGSIGEWKIIADPTAAGGRALAQTSTDRTDYRFPLAIYQPVSAKDIEVTAHFKPAAGQVDQAAGIALRLQTPDDYYVVRANALEDNVRFYRMVKGKREMIIGKNVKVASGQWHTLTLHAQGDQFTVTYDGQPLFTVGNTTFLDAGKVALWTKADSVTYFDRIEIRQLP